MNQPGWRGVRILKYPSDLVLYSQVIFQNKPDFIIETGTKFGGSSLFFADMFALFHPEGKVITIDVTHDQIKNKDPRIEYILGSSSDRNIVEQVRKEVEGKKVMVVLDSNHAAYHVKRELRLWSPLVTSGQYLVIEDCYAGARPYYPITARDWYLARTNIFKLEQLENQFFFAVTQGGWLKKL